MSLARRLVFVVIVLAVTCGAIFWILTTPQTIAAATLAARTADLANGEAMFNAGGCAGCHAGGDDRRRLGGGAPLKSPFGVFYVPNISPDAADGIGGWSEADFVTAMLRGTAPDGRHYYPSFPYTSYQRMSVDDVRDLFAYIKTLPPVQGRARDHDLPFPFNIRRGVGLWKLAFANADTFRADPAKPAAWNRGAYLVNGPGHCAECHSPRNFAGAIIDSHRFAGGPNPEGEGFIPNITQAKLGDWSEADFASFLESGQTPSFDSVSGSMEAVIKSTSQLSAVDREAMAVYLKSLPPVESLR